MSEKVEKFAYDAAVERAERAEELAAVRWEALEAYFKCLARAEGERDAALKTKRTERP